MVDWPGIIRDHGPLVWRIAHRLLHRDADVADCFQQTFLSAVQLSAGTTVRNWRGVLARIATARSLDLLRGRHRESHRLQSLHDNAPDDRALPDPSDLASGGELAAALRMALSEIDAQQAETFCLVCLEGLSNREAATALGVTANHAGVLLHRARAALRDRLMAFDPSREHSAGG